MYGRFLLQERGFWLLKANPEIQLSSRRCVILWVLSGLATGQPVTLHTTLSFQRPVVLVTLANDSRGVKRSCTCVCLCLSVCPQHNKKDGYRQLNVHQLGSLRPWNNRGKCYMDRKRIQCLSNASQHVPIYVQPFLRYSKLLIENCEIFTSHLCLAAQ